MIRAKDIAVSLPLLSFALTSPPAWAEDAIRYLVPYGGVDTVQDSVFGYSGIIAAIPDGEQSNIMLHGWIGKGAYNYPSVLSSDGEIDGDATWLHGLIGYQTNAWNQRFTGYVGVDYQDYELSPPDPGNEVSGAETGFFVSGDFETIDPKPFYAGAIAQYSTAFQWYWSRARVGYEFERLGKIVVGPEGVFFGNIGFDAQRAGGFLFIPVALGKHASAGLTLSGGYQWIGGDDNNGVITGSVGGVSDSPYGSINLHTAFY
jgi:hypothetical protein